MDDEQKQIVNRTNYAAIVEMANTEGWRIIKERLEYDVRFAIGLLSRPKPTSDSEWLIDEHGIGLARGIYKTAQKYLNMIDSAVSKTSQQN